MNQLTTAHLHHAYRRGWFPMGDEAGKVEWYQPYRRALMPISGMRASRSFQRKLRSLNGELQVSSDHCFERVMRQCLRPDGNWITQEIIEVFCQAHEEGWAHSFEVWRGDNLVGGLYGLAVGQIFSAESMFHRESDCSKVALWVAVNHCRSLGFHVFDAQILNPHLASLGAFEIEAAEYERLLHEHAYNLLHWTNLA